MHLWKRALGVVWCGDRCRCRRLCRRCQRVIYHLLEEVGDMMVGVAPKVEHQVVTGSAEVLQVFQLKGAR